MKNNSSKITIFNRYSQSSEEEVVYGGGWVKFIYGKFFLGTFIEYLLSFSKIPSMLMGFFYNSGLSKFLIPGFIKNYKIDMTEYSAGNVKKSIVRKVLYDLNFTKKSQLILPENSYKNFNHFFIREFKSNKRSWPIDLHQMGAFAEARYFGTEEIHDSLRFPVKGNYLRPLDLLGDEHEWTELFDRGPMLIARLCPVDYHRYHYPDEGKTLVSYSKSGFLHSVSPFALSKIPQTFIRNERRISILETKNFGKIAYIEIGALMVGKIIQTHDEVQPFLRGQQKGYFLFGGSTVVIIGQYKTWQPSEDILDHSYNGIETYVKLGDLVAIK